MSNLIIGFSSGLAVGFLIARVLVMLVSKAYEKDIKFLRSKIK